MNREQSGSRKIGQHICVQWNCLASDAACQVRLLWDGAPLVEKLLKRAGRETRVMLPFDMRREGGPPVVAGCFELALDHAGRPQGLVLELEQHGGGMQRYQLWPEQPDPPGPLPPGPLPPDPPSPIPEPPAGEAEAVSACIEQGTDTDLFPYLYLRPWTGASRQEREDNFIGYAPVPGGLYDKLVEAKKHGGRAAMERYAVAFASRLAPPRAEEGVPRLPEWMRRFPACHDALRALPAPDAQAVRLEVEMQLGCSWDALRQHVQGPGFARAIDVCWQGVLALNILLGDRRRQLDAFIKIVVLGKLLGRMMLLGEKGAEGQPPPEAKYWTPARIADGLAATLVLPDALFPLPAAKAAPQADTEADAEADSVVPYAIGDLELVRQRLKGYALGEVSRIDNLMRGEYQETTRRQLSRTSHSANERGMVDGASETRWSASGAERQDTARHSLSLEFEVDSSTTYGPPTDASATESIVVKPNPDKTPQQLAIDAAAEHARTVTSRTVARLARRVQWERASASLDEREESVLNRLDGSRNERHARGVYRWVDKIYEAYVVNYGQRLMLEFRVANPASVFVCEQQRLHGRSFSRPVPPGVPRYTDISVETGSPHYYADLIAVYEAYDVSLPPAASLTVSMSARVGHAGACQDIAIPDGYQATEATVSANWAGQEQSLDLFGLVGAQPFAISSKDQAQAGPPRSVSIALHGETGSLPFSIALAPPADAAAEPQYHPPICVASVDITLKPTEAALRQWQFGFYRAIQEAYQRRLRAWLEAVGAGAGPDSANPLAGRQTVRQALGRRLRRMLWRQACDRAGLTARDGARYEQFFEQAFEWKELSYSLGQDWETAELAAAGTLLPAFLEAESARVLVPVHPAYQSSIPYFLDSGMIWDADRRLVPAMEASVDLVNSLKQCRGGGHEDPVRSKGWQFRVPTTMNVIQQGEELPDFE